MHTPAPVPRRSAPRRPTVHALALAVVVAAALASDVRAQTPPAAPPVLDVTGTASVAVAPDRAHLRFAVETTAATAAAAAEQNALLMQAVLDALAGAEVEGMKVETRGFSLTPRYRRDREGNMTADGYLAANTVRVTMPDLDAVGPIIDAAIRAGANRVDGLSYSSTEAPAARLEALRRAVASAEAEAEAVAGALGLELGPPLEVRVAGAPRAAPETVQLRAAAGATPIVPSDLEVTASVTIRYRLPG